MLQGYNLLKQNCDCLLHNDMNDTQPAEFCEAKKVMIPFAFTWNK